MPIKPLCKGDTVALIAPAGPLTKDKIDLACERIREAGFVPLLMEGADKTYGYLAGSDEVRAAEVNRAFADDRIDAVFCLRGGYGVMRILDRIDFDMIRRHPKIFAGYSDITALHTAIREKCGFPTFHAPMPGGKVYEISQFLPLLTETDPPGGYHNPPDTGDLTCIAPGRARGILTGGNLSLIDGLLGTPYEPDLRGKILFIEEIGEKPYSLDRMFTHLRLAGKLEDCAGIILGRFTDCEAEDPQYSLSLDEIIRDVLIPCGKPVIGNLYCGHVYYSLALPLGVMCEMDADAASIRFPDSVFSES